MSSGGHHGGGGMENMPAMCPMMVLNACVTEEFSVIFSQWRVNSYLSFLLTVAIVFGLGVLYEGLQWSRWHIDQQHERAKGERQRWLDIRHGHQSDPDLLGHTTVDEFSSRPPSHGQTHRDRLRSEQSSPSVTSPLLASPERKSTPRSQPPTRPAIQTTLPPSGERPEQSTTSVYFDDLPHQTHNTYHSAYQSFRMRRLRWCQILLHGLHTLYGMFVMLIAMTYNIWLLIALAVGASVGYAIFAKQRSGYISAAMTCH